MAAESGRTDLGTPAPPISLPDPTGKVHAVTDDAAGAPLLVLFLCNHCPYVRHVADRLGSLTTSAMSAGLVVVGINSNDWDAYPDDAPVHMAAFAAEHGWAFPYLVDEDQSVARAYEAVCTPDIFLFDRAHRLVYRGQFDSSRPGNDVVVTGDDFEAAVVATLAGEVPATAQVPSVGCSIKWR